MDIRVTRARSQLVMDHPFFGSLIMRMAMAACTALKDKTMATDGTSIWYHPEFLDEVTAAELLGILVHELFHCILGHHVRRGDRDPDRWNRACDYVVNPMVLAAGFVLPKWVLLDPQYAGLNAEQVYRLLEQEEEKQQQQQQDDDGDDGQDREGYSDDQDRDSYSADDDSAGDDDDTSEDSDPAESSNEEGEEEGDEAGEPDDLEGDQEGDADQNDDGQDGDQSGDEAGDAEDGSEDGEGTGDAHDGPNSQGDPGRCGEILDAAPAHDKAALSEAEGEWEVAVRQAVNIAKRQGNTPGFINEIIDHLNEPQVSWRDILDRFVDPATTKDFSWMNPSRRMLTLGHYVPGMVSDGVSHVGMVIDSSYSIDTELLKTFGAEVQAALDTGRIDKLTVIFCDTRVTKHDEYSQGDLIDWTVPGRGGTAFSPAFDWLNENAPDVQCAIYFTDMECTDFGVAPVYPVLWAGYGDPRKLKTYMAAAPFGECVDVSQ
jgi:predicted metal-dependent peptidase